MRKIETIDELRSLVGQDVATSGWLLITQERVTQFAEATGDQQWIHVDVERCKKESPYGGTIVHGFLTLSMLSLMVGEAICMPAAGVALNYGLNKVRFPSPVLTGTRVRGKLHLLSVEDIPKGVQFIWQVTMENEGNDKPACIAESIIRLYR